MTPDLQKAYAGCILKRDWRGAVQILKVALDRESGDTEAMRQLSDMRGRFHREAEALMAEAESRIASGNRAEVLQSIKGLDEEFPEWVELCDSSDVLTTLWNVKFIKPAAPPNPKPEEREQTAPSKESKAEESLRELLGRAGSSVLAESGVDDLRQLEKQLEEAEHGFALGVNTGAITKKQVAESLTKVRAAIADKGSRAILRNVAIFVGLLLILGIGAWALWARNGLETDVPKLPPTPPLKGKLTKELCNPRESKDDFLLPMPENGVMAFRMIGIPGNTKEGERAPSLEFDGLGEGKEKLKVYAPFEVGQERCYYLGKYEVTEGQFDAIMSPSLLRGNSLPMRNVTFDQAQEFCVRYTQWIQRQYRDRLPKSKRGTLAVIRLPESVEWEFAARGGNRTHGSPAFSKRFPFAEADLNRYEWFGGDKSSNNQIHKIGELKPNVLGCYDLLGNVREITRTKLQRAGAYLEAMVVRGGDAWTEERDVSVSLETEHPLAAPNGGPFETERHGFRVLLGTSEPDWQPQSPSKSSLVPEGEIRKQQ